MLSSGGLSKKQKLAIPTAIILQTILSSQMSALIEPISSYRIISSLDHITSLDTITSGGNVIAPMLIGTHDGSFHCDEVLAISMLSFLPQYKPSPATYIVRTRNEKILEKCNIVVDVGAVYDPSNHRYDHHQRSFLDHLDDNHSTKLSSAGLVYKHFGKDIIRAILKETDKTNDPSEEVLSALYYKLYRDFMEHIDAIDNGISVSIGEPRYHISTTLSSRVGRFNPAWNEPQSPEIFNDQFSKAMALTGSEFLSHLDSLKGAWWPARSIVIEALDKRFDIVPEGTIIVFDTSCPWKDHLFELEEQLGITNPIIYALYQDTGGSWRVQAVPLNPNSFDSRKKLPSEWCGLRDAELSEKAGISDCIFVHASGFIGGAATKQAAMAMAVKALQIE